MATTPGPWRVGNLLDATDDRGDERAIHAGDTEAVIAAVYPMGADFDDPRYPNGVDGEREANARLIAAAPDLLTAVRQLLLAENLIDDAYYVAIHDAMTLAYAAIAKAEGQPA